MSREKIEPYKHDCKVCKFVTWIKLSGDRWANMYVHPGGWVGTFPEDWSYVATTVILRLSDEPGDVLAYIASDHTPKLAIEVTTPCYSDLISQGSCLKCSSDTTSIQEKNVPLKQSPTLSSGRD